MEVLTNIAAAAGAISAITVLVVALKKIINFIVGINKIKISIENIDEYEKKVDQMDTGLKALAQSIKQMQQSIDEMNETIKLQNQLSINVARFTLEKTMRKSIDRGYVTIEEKMLVGDLFDSYIDAHGNHGVEDLYNSSYKDLPVDASFPKKHQ